MSHPRLNPQHPCNDEPLDPTELMGLSCDLTIIDELDELIEQQLTSLDAQGY